MAVVITTKDACHNYCVLVVSFFFLLSPYSCHYEPNPIENHIFWLFQVTVLVWLVCVCVYCNTSLMSNLTVASYPGPFHPERKWEGPGYEANPTDVCVCVNVTFPHRELQSWLAPYPTGWST